MSNQKHEWSWYGCWLVDWLTCDPISDGWGEDFYIWAKAYRKANPELDELTDLELINEHYEKAMEPIFNSWIFFIWEILQGPMYCIHWLWWQIKQKFF